jgi:hypothetical protein
MAGLAAKLADRFKPGIFDRLKQSAEAKKQARDKRLHVVPPKTQTAIDIETRHQQYSPTGRLLESQTIFAEPTGMFRREQVWREWTANSMITTNTASTTSCISCNEAWDIWQDTGTAGTSTVWNAWTTNQVIIRTSNVITTSNVAWETWQDQEQPRRYQRNVETPEQRRQRDAEEAKWRAEEAARTAKWQEDERVRLRKAEEANDRAMKLLVSMLNDQQRADLKRDKHFFVDAPSGRLYRIDYGTHGNVKVVDRQTRKIIERLCIQPNGVPAGDANLMQKLLIETAEETFRAHANITLEDGRMVYGKREHLDNVELAKVIPLRRAA